MTTPADLAPDDPMPDAELAALYLSGALPDDEYRAFEARLSTGDPAADAALRGLADAVRVLADGCPPVDPPPRVRDAVLAAVDPRAADRAAAGRLTGVHFRFADDDHEFVPTETPGVRLRMLHLDRARRTFTVLLRMDPGTSLPAHPHDGAEECLLLDGDITLGGVRMRRGDYQRFDAGVPHGDNRTEGGALVYVTAPLGLLHHH